MSQLDADFTYFEERLADPTLLRQSVIVTTATGVIGVAVPVGGRRRGGYLPLSTRRDCRAAMRQLREYPDRFPNLRVIWADTHQAVHTVCWGEIEPETPPLDASDAEWAEYDRAAGAYYGYSERAIEELVVGLWGGQQP